jgi:methyl-accepting chemotaxis protein
LIAIQNDLGEQVLEAYSPLTYQGITWAFVSEISADTISAPLGELRDAVLMVIVPIILLAAVIAWFLSARFSRPIKQIISAVRLMAAGTSTEVPGTERGDEIGDLARSMDQIRQKGLEAARLRSALDCSANMVMVANARGDIVYLNPTLLEMMRRHEEVIRKDLPEFEADKLLGANFDVFHKNPERKHKMLDGLTGPTNLNILVGGRRMRLSTTPVTTVAGERIGTVADWQDLTDELRVQEQIGAVVDAMGNGDFSKRIEAAGIDGMLATIASGVNDLVDVVSGVVQEIGTSINALSTGDLTKRSKAEYNGAFGDLQRDVNATADRISTVVGELKAASASISNLVGEINAGASELSQRTESAAVSLEETSAATEEVSATVNQNAHHATEAQVVAASAEEAAKRGVDVVSGSGRAMSSIAESAKKVSEIVNVITGVAFQTNLLALNASVEAARAGEAGNGFAVVASEVRNLAQRCSEAADNVKTLIDETNFHVRDGVAQVTGAGEALKGILSASQNVAGIIGSIASASNEQAAGISEISKAINHLDELTQGNAGQVQNTAATVANLRDVAEQLAEITVFFKLDTNDIRPNQGTSTKANVSVAA